MGRETVLNLSSNPVRSLRLCGGGLGRRVAFHCMAAITLYPPAAANAFAGDLPHKRRGEESVRRACGIAA